MNKALLGAEWALRLIGHGLMSDEDMLDMLNGHLSEWYTANEMADMTISYMGGIASGYELRNLVHAIYDVEFTRYF